MAFFAQASLLMRTTLDAQYGIYPSTLRRGIGVGEAKTDPPSLSRRSAGLQSCYDLSCYAKQRLRGCCELSTALRGMRSCIASYALIEAAKLQSATARFREAVQRGRGAGGELRHADRSGCAVMMRLHC
jgi:hypothetical protein